MTEEEIINVSHIPDSEILFDINETQKEIESYRIILNELYKKRQENKVEIYMKEGKILQRETFINDLNQILNYRKTAKLLTNANS